MDRSVEPEEEQTACDAAHTASFTTDMPPCLLLIAVVKERTLIEKTPDPSHKKQEG